MKKKVIMSLLKAKSTVKQIIESKSGGVLSENAFIIAGIAGLVALVFILIYAFAEDRFLQGLFGKAMNTFNLI